MKYNTYQGRLAQLFTIAQPNIMHVILSLLKFHT